MKYKLIIDKNVEEEILAIVHEPSSLTEQIENLVYSFTGADFILGCKDDETRKLAFQEMECITILNRKVIAIDGMVINTVFRTGFAIWRRFCPLILYALTNPPLLMNIAF